MIKTAQFGDVHLRAFKLKDVSEAWKKANYKADEIGVDLKIQLGDIFDKANILLGSGQDSAGSRYASVGDVLEAGMEPLEKSKTPTIIIRGNHCKPGKNEKDALVALERIPHVEVIRNQRILNVPINGGLNQVVLACLPWLDKVDVLTEEELKHPHANRIFQDRNHERICELADEMKSFNNCVKMVIGHLHLIGSMAHPGHVMPDTPYSFTLDELKYLGAGAIYLGHFHRKDDFYVGALTQMGFGAQGDPTGFMVTEWEDDGKFIRDYFVEVKSPKYWKFNTFDEFNKQDIDFTGDYVRIKEANPGMVVSGNVNIEFVPDIEIEEYCRRSEIEPNAGIKAFLEEYFRLNYEKADGLLLDNLRSLMDEAESIVGGQLVGSVESDKGIEFINRIRLKNIGLHKDNEVIFDDHIAAITGRNGIGKTYLLEAILGCFFGDFPTAPGSIYDAMTLGVMGDALIEVDFIAGGKSYRAIRKINKTAKTTSSEAFLYEGDDGKSITSGKGSDFVAKIESLVGGKKHLLATCFSSQENEGDFFGMSESERKTYFSDIIGINQADVYNKHFLEKAKLLQSQIDSANVEAKVYSSIDPEKKVSLATLISEMEKKKGDLNNAIIVKNKTINSKRTQLAQIEAGKAEWNNNRRKYLDAEKEVLSSQEKLNSLDGRRKKLNEIISKKESVESRKKTYEDLEVEVKSLSEQQIKKAKAEQEVRDLVHKQDTHRTSIKNKKENLERTISLKKKDIERLQQKMVMLDASGCKGSIDCPFLKDAKQAEEDIKKVREELAASEKDLSTEIYAHSDLVYIGNLEEQIQAIYIPDFNDLDYKRKQNELNGLKAYQKDELEVARAEAEIPSLDSLEKELVGKNEDAIKNLSVYEAYKGEAPDNGENEIRRAVEEQDARIKDMQNQISTIDRDIGKKQAEIKQIEENEGRAKVLMSKIKSLEQDRQYIDFLALAFGKDGIPQLLIDAAIPRIQAILDEMVKDLDRPFRISLGTQKVKKSGGLSEGLPIYFTNHIGTMDGNRASVGLRQIIRTMYRWAVSLFNQQQGAGASKVYIGDEPFKSLDIDNRTHLMQIFMSKKEWFNQVILASHEDELISQIRCRYELYDDGGFTKIRRF